MSIAIAENRPAEVQSIIDCAGNVVPQQVTLSLPFGAVQNFVESAPPPRRPNRNRPIHDDLDDIAANQEARESGPCKPISELWDDLGV